MQVRESDRGWDMHLRAVKHGIPAEVGEYSYPARDVQPTDLWSVLNLEAHNHVFPRYPRDWFEALRLKALEQINAFVRGDFNPNSASLCFGSRDILDPHRGDLGWFLTRAICSLTIIGYGLVAESPAMERQILQIGEVRELHAGMQAIFGEVGVAAVPNF